MAAVNDDDVSPATARALQHRLAVGQRDGRVPSVVAAVARRGAPVWFGAAGEVDAAQPLPDTQYRIGSITKTMVAVLVMRLVERGDIGLDDPLGDHLPDAPAPASTVRQLLTHTAGIASETPPPWWERTGGAVRPELRDILTSHPLRHPPGHTFHYSNPGFGLLGALVTARAGRPWFDELAEAVLEPLGMGDTSYLPRTPHARGWAVHPFADVVLPEPVNDHGLLAAAGQLWSTPGDLARFGVFLHGDGNGILTADTLRRMRQPASGANDPQWLGSYGLGMQLFRFGDRVLSGHSGSMPGFVAMLISSPDDGLTVALAANAWGEFAARAVVGDLFEIVREQEPTRPQPWRPATAVAADAFALVGPWYWGASGYAITLRADGDLELAGLGGGGRAARFVRAPDGRWRGRNGYYAGEFLEVVRDADGAISHLDLGSFVFTRRPYAPGAVVPGGLELGDWRV